MFRREAGSVLGVVAVLALLVGCGGKPPAPVVFEDVVAFEPPPGWLRWMRC